MKKQKNTDLNVHLTVLLVVVVGAALSVVKESLKCPNQVDRLRIEVVAKNITTPPDHHHKPAVPTR